MSAFNCSCQLINFNCPQLATECSGKYGQRTELKGKEGCFFFYATRPSHAIKQISAGLGRKLFAYLCEQKMPLEATSSAMPLKRNAKCRVKMEKPQLRRGKRTNAAHLAEAKGIFSKLQVGLAQVDPSPLYILGPIIGMSHTHAAHMCHSGETNALSRNFIHKDFISLHSISCPVSKRPQGVGRVERK